MKLFLLVLILFFTTNLWATDEHRQAESMVVLKGEYIQDNLIFTTFLSILLDENENTLRMTASNLGFDIDDARDLKEFRKLQRKMELVDKKLKKSLRNSWYKAHCTGGKGGYGQSRKEMLSDMDTAENMRKETTDNSIRNALKSMSAENRAKVRSYLKDMKERSKVTIIDNEEFEKDSSVRDMETRIARGCVEQSGEYFSN